jgi:hypothetical protein
VAAAAVLQLQTTTMLLVAVAVVAEQLLKLLTFLGYPQLPLQLEVGELLQMVEVHLLLDLIVREPVEHPDGMGTIMEVSAEVAEVAVAMVTWIFVDQRGLLVSMILRLLVGQVDLLFGVEPETRSHIIQGHM